MEKEIYFLKKTNRRKNQVVLKHKLNAFFELSMKLFLQIQALNKRKSLPALCFYAPLTVQATLDLLQ